MPVGGGIFAFAALVLWAYCIFDVISTDESRITNLPKMFWLLIVIFIPTIGSVAWLLLGRPSGAAWRPGSTEPRQPRLPPPPPPTLGLPERAISPEDHAAKREEALRRYNEEREEELRRREEDLRRREEEFRRRELGEADGGE
jgi:hypothetical protein